MSAERLMRDALLANHAAGKTSAEVGGVKVGPNKYAFVTYTVKEGRESPGDLVNKVANLTETLNGFVLKLKDMNVPLTQFFGPFAEFEFDNKAVSIEWPGLATLLEQAETLLEASGPVQVKQAPSEITPDIIQGILRDTIKVDASGLAPAVVSHHITGFDEAAERILKMLSSSSR